MYNYAAMQTHQVERTAVVVLLKEPVLALGLFVCDDLWLVPGVGSSLLLCHVMELLNLLLLLLLPGWTRSIQSGDGLEGTRYIDSTQGSPTIVSPPLNYWSLHI